MTELAQPQKLIQNIFWPKLDSVESAQRAIRSALYAGIFLYSLTFVVSLLPLFGVNFIGIELSVLPEAVLMGSLLIGMHKKSRICSVALTVYFFWAKTGAIIASFPKETVIQGMWLSIFLLTLLNGTRGVFAFYKLSGAKPQGFRRQSLAWILGSVFLILLVGAFSVLGSVHLTTNRLGPIISLVRQSKFDEAEKLTDAALLQYGSIPSARGFQYAQ